MDILKQLKKQAEQVEVLDMQAERTTVEFEANQLKTCTVAETRGTALRVIRKGRLGFAASTDAQAGDRLAANALESASYGDAAPFSFPAPQSASTVRTFDQALADLPVDRLVALGREALDLILPVEADLRCNISLERSLSSLTIRNQAGLEISYQSSPFTFGVEIDRIEANDVLILYDQVSTSIPQTDPLDFVRRLVEKLRLARRLTDLKPGRMPVVFSPVAATALGLPLCEGLNGRQVFKGTSPLAGRSGEKLFDEKITLVDDGTLDGLPGSAAYDDEGVPHHRNVLVEKGVLKGFVYDLKTAAQSDAASTGNAARSLFAPPEPAFSNVMLQAGETPLKDILSGIDRGLLVEGLIGVGQGNMISGAFSNPLALAFKVEKGEIVGRVKDLSIAGNIYDLLKQVGALSRETQWVFTSMFPPYSFSAPYVFFPDMTVAGKA